MNLPENRDHGQDAAKAYKIFVNTREKTVTTHRLTFDQVVILAYGPPNYDTSVYTVTYRDGPPANPHGRLVEGQSVEIKNEMIFNVVRTDKS